MQIGIVGLPYSGKTTFFQTLTETMLDAGTQQKRDANQAVVKIPDVRLDKLTDIFQPKKKVNSTLEIVDMVGLQQSEGKHSITTQFLTKVRTNDAVIHVVRGFNDPAVPMNEGGIDMLRDIKMLEDEFIFNDLVFIESRLEKIEKDLLKQKNKDQLAKEKETLEKWHKVIQNNTALREMDQDEEDIKYIKNYQPLSAKPLMIALNLDESDTGNLEPILQKIKTEIKWKNVEVEPFFAKIELELNQLAEDEKAMFMEEYGIKESSLSRLIRSAYNLLGLQSFFTVGEDECRAWTIKKGMTAQDSAGVIHTDFYNKFIRAEVVSYKDFMECQSFAKCKEKGVFRLEGKEYITCDGDILHVRHG